MTNDVLASLRLQMQQLAELHAAGALGEAQYQEARVAVEKRIVDAVVQEPAAPAAPAASKASRPLIAGLTLAVIAVAAAGYFLRGSPKELLAPSAAEPAAGQQGSAHPLTSEEIEGMIAKLAARLKERPDDADGWAMLGRSYAVLGKHEQAAPALKQAMALRPDDAVLIADYADALAVVNGGKLDGEPAALIARALQVDPDNLKALSLAGTIAFDRKDYATALQHWEKLAKLAPTSDFAKQIRNGIDDARKLMAGAPADAAKPTAAATGTSISGTVTLAAALADKANPTDTLFVFARAAEGPRMPLAILRKQVKDLPLAFTLDDGMAMTPQMKLSSVSKVVVGARISKRGDATAQPGDLQGLSAPIAPGATGLKLEIAQTVGP